MQHAVNGLIRRDPQIAKYRKLTPNLLVTDYLRFILVTPACPGLARVTVHRDSNAESCTYFGPEASNT